MNRTATLLLAALVAAATACASSGTGEPATAPPPAAAGGDAGPPPPPRAPVEGLFTEAQAVRGRATFRSVCADCHYSSEFRDSQFQFKWGRRTVAELYRNIVENMPDDAPGSLERQQYVDVVSYILQLNGFPAGPSELTAEGPGMSGVTLMAPSDPRQSVRRVPRTP
jgi:mono/diheme cytochrome c family protein